MSTPEIASREVKPKLLLRHISALTHPSALRDEMAKDCSNLVPTNGRQEQGFLCQNWEDMEARGSSLWSTGKSTMIAAMANLLNYDVYDLELTAVKDNTELRKLLVESTSKSIIVIEDIDCSLDLTGQRTKKEEKSPDENKEKSEKEIRKEHKEESSSSKVTLSGLLNFIDGLWSACGGERLIVFTTNYVEKLDPALTRGRMDKHIELSYCIFEAFEVLSRNYLRLEAHPLLDKIESLMKETKITPADVAENLMPKSPLDDAEKCLSRLIQALEEAAEATENDERSIHKKSSSSYQGSRGPCHGRCCPTTRK
ncbi:hypothetical protein Peur_072310 [Populus x canadensis]